MIPQGCAWRTWSAKDASPARQVLNKRKPDWTVSRKAALLQGYVAMIRESRGIAFWDFIGLILRNPQRKNPMRGLQVQLCSKLPTQTCDLCGASIIALRVEQLVNSKVEEMCKVLFRVWSSVYRVQGLEFSVYGWGGGGGRFSFKSLCFEGNAASTSPGFSQLGGRFFLRGSKLI